MIGKITIVVSFKMMHYISQCSSLSLQAVFNGVLQTVGAVDLQEVKLICSRTNKISWLWQIHQWVLCLHQMLMILGNSHRFYLLPIMEIQSAVFTPYIHIRNCYVVWRNPEKILPKRAREERLNSRRLWTRNSFIAQEVKRESTLEWLFNDSDNW